MRSMHFPDFAETLQPVFEALPHVAVAYLFGSHARGQAGPLSDVDIAILLSDQPNADVGFEARLDIIGRVMTQLQRNEVDVTILNQAPLTVRYRVAREGQVLFCRDHDARIAFTAQTVMAYLDFQPMLKTFERATLDRARKGTLTHGYNPHHGTVERYRRLRERLESASAPDLH
jgi:hypothetical protein